jgi:hypothetical protein
MATAARTKPNPTHFILIDENYNSVVQRGSKAELEKLAADLNRGEKRTRYYVIGKSWGDPEGNPMKAATRNPSEPEGTATERVVTYYRTPKYRKGREWLERELGQMRLFEYNPAHLKVEKIGAKYGVLLNSQVLRRDLTKPQATQIVKELKTRAANIQKRNPSAEFERIVRESKDWERQQLNQSVENADVAADVAENLIDVFDVTGDGDIDRRDVEILRSFVPEEPQLVVDAENEVTGEILTETVDGDVVIEWADGKTTVENKDDLAYENGFKSWRLRRKAARQYKKGLKYEEMARKAKARQSEIESGLKKNPDLLSTFANLAVGTAAALEVQKQLNRKGKTKKRSMVKKPNPSISQLVATARKQGKTKVAVLVANMAKVKEYARQNGGAVRKHGIRYFYFLPKTAKNPAVIKSGRKTVSKPGRKSNPMPKRASKKVSMTVTELKNFLTAKGGKHEVWKNSDSYLIGKKSVQFAVSQSPNHKDKCIVRLKNFKKPNPKNSNVINRAKKSTARNVNVRAKKANPATAKPRLKRNDAYAAFQGRPSTKAMEMVTPPKAPRRLWTLGKLFEIKVKGQSAPLNFRREASGKTFYLCADEQNKQLWIAGGRIAERDTSMENNEFENLGEIIHVVYETEKTHLGDDGLPSAYIHKMGEEGGEKPTFEIDRDGFAYFIGGDYEITPLGIKN